MKKAIAALLAMFMALPFAFADVEVGYRVTTYDETDALVGEKGYIDISDSNLPDVFVCANKDGTQMSYGMNLQNDEQIGYAKGLVEMLSKLSFAEFDSYGCLRTRA